MLDSSWNKGCQLKNDVKIGKRCSLQMDVVNL